MIHCATVDQTHLSNLMCSYSIASNTVADLMVIFHWLTVWTSFVVCNWSANEWGDFGWVWNKDRERERRSRRYKITAQKHMFKHRKLNTWKNGNESAERILQLKQKIPNGNKMCNDYHRLISFETLWTLCVKLHNFFAKFVSRRKIWFFFSQSINPILLQTFFCFADRNFAEIFIPLGFQDLFSRDLFVFCIK